jgi:formylglycine-generating enzyme required for sulfatase activity
MRSLRCWILAVCLGCTEEATSDMVELETTDGHIFHIDIYEYPNKKGETPVHPVDLDTAKSTCASQGKRLCTATEWRRACAGPSGSRRYAYGAGYIPRICHTQVDLPSGHSSMLSDTSDAESEDLTASAGAYRDCLTDEGVYDLIGNVEEWVLDSWRGVGGMLEGGAYYSHRDYTDCTGQYSRQPDYRLAASQDVQSAGFRCCTSETEPTAAEIGLDATQRLEEARLLSSTQSYDSASEVEVQPGLFMDRYEYPNRPGEMPLRALSWHDAEARCDTAGKRLCTAAEWENACAGAEKYTQPYGSLYRPGACPVYLTAATVSGSHPACATQTGVYDLTGGVWEWTSTPLDAESLKVQDDEILREVRGGSWMVEDRKASCRPTDGYPAAPEAMAFPDVGFRCCRGQAQATEVQDTSPAMSCPSGLVLSGESCISTMEFPANSGQVPRGNLNWNDALSACSGQGLRVCSEREWETACEGPSGRRWPYGNVYNPDACFTVTGSEHTEVNARPSGAQPECGTPDGVLDMSGNLWEWTRASDGSGVLRGGGWNFSAGLGQCRSRAEAEATHAEAQLGVRCCTDPVPIAAPGVQGPAD